MSYQEELLIRIRSAYESGGFNKLDADLSKAKGGYNQLQSTSAKSTGAMASQMSSASASVKSFGSTVVGAFDGLGGMITGVVAGFGLVTMATSAWTGATQAQLNKMLLTKKYGADMAESLVKNIQEIVAAVPGDDTFMNSFLSGVARVGNISNVDSLKKVAYIASDYMNASLAAGKMGYEIQQDLTKYILYGNTAELERGSILSSQIDSLKNKASIEERVLAMNEAMKKLGLDGLSQLDSASNKWEEVKGNIQLILTQFGTDLLPYIQAVFKGFLDINESTGGWAARIVVISGILIALVPIIGMLAGPFATGATLIWGMVSAVTGLKAASTGAAVGQQTLDAWLNNTSNSAGKASGGLRGFATSAAGATIGIAAMVAALIGVTYLMSQANSAAVAWNQAQQQRNDQVDAFNHNANVLKAQESELIEKRDAATKAGKSTFLIEEQLAAKRLEIANNTNAATDAEKRWIDAHGVRQALESRGTIIGSQAELEGAAAAKGQTPEQYLQDTGSDPDTRNALEKTAMLWNNINAPKLKYAGTMERINKGEDTYARKMKENQSTFQQYNKDYQDYYRSSEAFFQAQEKGDIGGMIREGVMSGYFQARVGLTEMSVAFNSWAEDTGNAIKKPFTDAYMWIVSSWDGLPVWFGGLGSRIGQLWGDVVNYFNDKTTIGGQVYDALKKIYCIIAGCSPGLLPILAQLYQYFIFVFNAILSPVIAVKNTIESFVLYIMLRMALLQNDIITRWNLVRAIVGIWIQTGINIFTDPIGWAKDRYNEAKGIIEQMINTSVSVATNALDTAWKEWQRLKNFVEDPITGIINVVLNQGSAGSPTEIDYLYGTGDLYESDYTPNITSIAAATSPISTTTTKTVISPIINIESIDSKETADYTIQKITKELSDLNDSKGR